MISVIDSKSASLCSTRKCRIQIDGISIKLRVLNILSGKRIGRPYQQHKSQGKQGQKPVAFEKGVNVFFTWILEIHSYLVRTNFNSIVI